MCGLRIYVRVTAVWRCIFHGCLQPRLTGTGEFGSACLTPRQRTRITMSRLYGLGFYVSTDRLGQYRFQSFERTQFSVSRKLLLGTPNFPDFFKAITNTFLIMHTNIMTFPL
jgi:hypothetical protein